MGWGALKQDGTRWAWDSNYPSGFLHYFLHSVATFSL